MNSDSISSSKWYIKWYLERTFSNNRKSKEAMESSKSTLLRIDYGHGK